MQVIIAYNGYPCIPASEFTRKFKTLINKAVRLIKSGMSDAAVAYEIEETKGNYWAGYPIQIYDESVNPDRLCGDNLRECIISEYIVSVAHQIIASQ